ncbi:MAG: hypothetical protein ACKOW7_03095, partial [Methylophilaceae bacterium]
MKQAAHSILILCSSPRLARALRQIEASKFHSQGQQVWHPAQIQTLSEWSSGIFKQSLLCG